MLKLLLYKTWDSSRSFVLKWLDKFEEDKKINKKGIFHTHEYNDIKHTIEQKHKRLTKKTSRKI